MRPLAPARTLPTEFKVPDRLSYSKSAALAPCFLSTQQMSNRCSVGSRNDWRALVVLSGSTIEEWATPIHCQVGQQWRRGSGCDGGCQGRWRRPCRSLGRRSCCSDCNTTRCRTSRQWLLNRCAITALEACPCCVRGSPRLIQLQRSSSTVARPSAACRGVVLREVCKCQ